MTQVLSQTNKCRCDSCGASSTPQNISLIFTPIELSNTQYILKTFVVNSKERKFRAGMYIGASSLYERILQPF